MIAVEDNKKDAIEYLEEAAKDEPNIQVAALKTKYPQGAERMLIYAVTGRKLNSSMLPADVGCVVDNCDTVVSLYRAAVQGRPLMHRIVTVVQEMRYRIPETFLLHGNRLPGTSGGSRRTENRAGEDHFRWSHDGIRALQPGRAGDKDFSPPFSV